MSVENVMSLFELITDFLDSRIYGVFYGGYCYVNTDTNILSTFFVSLCDYIIVYKKTSIVARISEINSRFVCYSDEQEAKFRNLIEYLTFLTGQGQYPSESLVDLRKYINNNYDSFAVAIQKILTISTNTNFYSPKARDLKKINFEELKTRFCTGRDLQFSNIICLLDELNVTLKIINTKSKTVEELNPGCEDTLFLMIHDSLLYIVYPKEEYLLSKSDADDYFKMLAKVTESFEASKISGNFGLEEAKTRQNNSLLTLVSSICNVYKDYDILQIKDFLETDIQINEILIDFLCYHCLKPTEYKSKCGHALCLEYYNKSTSPEFRCPKCNTY